MPSLMDVLDRIGSPDLLVFGDLILDRYVEGRSHRVSPEAPVLVFQSGSSSFRLGGAGNVAANVVSAGGRACCLGLVGDDLLADSLEARLRDHGISTDGVFRDPGRPTTVKTRFVSGTHQVLRVDEESREIAMNKAGKRLATFLDERLGDFDALILSDYGKGVLSDAHLEKAIGRAREKGIPVLVDPKGPDFTRYRGATLITPNRAEAEEASGMKILSDSDLQDAAERLVTRAELESIVITLGKDGIFFRSKDGRHDILPTEARAVFDVTGAGDTVVALLGLALGAGIGLEDAVRLANLGAGIVVGCFGTATVTKGELLGVLGVHSPDKILGLESLAGVVARLRRDHKRIVFTNGCFDLLHPGHLDYLTKARSYGDLLILGINDDPSVRRLNGKGRPVFLLEDRMRMLAGLEVVDYIVPFSEDTPLELIKKIGPQVLVKGEDWRDKGVVGREHVESQGGQVVLVPLVEGYSTTALIDKIRGKGDS